MDTIYDFTYRGWQLKVKNHPLVTYDEDDNQTVTAYYFGSYRAPGARKATPTYEGFETPEDALKRCREAVDASFEQQAKFAAEREDNRLDKVLEEINAKHLRRFQKDSWGTIDAYAGENGKMFLVEERNECPLTGRQGFEIYVPLTESNLIRDTINALKTYLYKS